MVMTDTSEYNTQVTENSEPYETGRRAFPSTTRGTTSMLRQSEQLKRYMNGRNIISRAIFNFFLEMNPYKKLTSTHDFAPSS